MLCDVKADADGGGVALAHFEIDVSHGAVEVEFGGVDDGAVGLAALGEMDHVFAIAKGISPAGFLEAGVLGPSTRRGGSRRNRSSGCQQGR